MRLYVFALSIILIFFNVQTVYANPLVGLIIRQGLLAKTAKGAVKIAKENKKGLLYTLFGGAVGGAVGDVAAYCVKNKKICKEVLGESWDIVEDMLGDNNDDINTCRYDAKEFTSKEELCDYFFKKANAGNNKSYTFATSYKVRDNYCLVYGGTNKYDGNVGTSFNCQKFDKNKYIEQVINQTINNKSDTEINNIIEKHITEIEINNYCSNGGKCDELSKQFADEVFKKLDKYDIDKIDRDNCEFKNNKIVSCEKAKIKKDDEEENQQEENNETEKGDKDNKINCESSEFHKKVCDFIDWYQDDDYQPKENDKEQTVKDLSDTLKIDDKRVKFNAQCPPDKHFEINYMGVTKTSKISYTRYCEFFILLKPFLIGLAGISSVLIITGGIRRG